MPAAPAAWLQAVRAFGCNRDDLDIDLGDADRPALVTRVLASCLGGSADWRATEDSVWEWTLAERLQGLLAIAIANGGEQPPWQMRCGGCTAAIEIDVAPSAFVALPQNDAVLCNAPDGRTVTARLPRGSDQRTWRAAAGDPVTMVTTLIERVDGAAPGPGWRVPADWLDPLADALADADPLTALQFHASCPSCGHVNVVDFDLEGWILGLLADEQERLIDDVHTLAGVYHWSEEAICALPPWRRRAYLARIEREAGP
jgi:hypothetical protein